VPLFEAILARVLIYFLAYLLALPVGHLAVRHVVLRKFQPQEAAGPKEADKTTGCLERLLTIAFGREYHAKEAGGFKGAGCTIGYLERLLTLTFVLLGEYEALALVLAAKSIARFQELKEREFAEYYLIGTLSSILFAMLIGIFASWLLGLL